MDEVDGNRGAENRDGSDEPPTGAGRLKNTLASVQGVLRPVLALLGIILIIIGVPIAILTPFPFVPIGLPIVILGCVLLARNSMSGRRWMQSTLERYPTLERFAPSWLLKLILGESK